MLLKILERRLYIANGLFAKLIRVPSAVLVIRRRKTEIDVIPISECLQEFPGLVF